MSDAIDYAELALAAMELIEANGRYCTFSRLGRQASDPAKPWRAPTGNVSGPNPPVSYGNITAVIFPEEYQVKRGEIVRTGYETLLVAHNSLLAGNVSVDPRTFDSVDDGTFVWQVKGVIPLIPGNTELIWQFTLEH